MNTQLQAMRATVEKLNWEWEEVVPLESIPEVPEHSPSIESAAAAAAHSSNDEATVQEETDTVTFNEPAFDLPLEPDADASVIAEDAVHSEAALPEMAEEEAEPEAAV